MDRIEQLDRTGTLTLRWREARHARGALRLAQRVRADVMVADLPLILDGVARLAYRISSVDDLGGGLRATVFRTGVAPFEMPWPGLLEDVLAGGR